MLLQLRAMVLCHLWCLLSTEMLVRSCLPCQHTALLKQARDRHVPRSAAAVAPLLRPGHGALSVSAHAADASCGKFL